MNSSSAADNHGSLELEFKHYAQVCTWATVFNELVSLNSGEDETVSEWLAALEGVAFTLLIKGDIYKFLTTVFGMTAEEIGKALRTGIKNFNAKKMAETFASVYKQLEAAGIDPHRVAPKILYPILDGVSLEEDDYLKKKWTNLLASAIAEGQTHPSYISVLSDLSALDAKVLQAISDIEKAGSRYSVGEHTIFEKLSEQLEAKIIAEKVRQHLHLTPEEIDKRESLIALIRESIDNLKRLNLVNTNTQRQLHLTSLGSEDPRRLVSVQEDNSSLGLSNFGTRFLRAIS
jgi:hypothetical protein